MEPDVLFLGWDVGTWMCKGESEDALQALRWHQGTLSAVGKSYRDNLYLTTGGTITVESLLTDAGVRPLPAEAKVIVAIDAVFGWPRRFRQLLDGKAG